jgi:hypothetical protein
MKEISKRLVPQTMHQVDASIKEIWVKMKSANKLSWHLETGVPIIVQEISGEDVV